MDYVVLAGYLKLIPPQLVRAFPRAMLNIHPGLLPAFGGSGLYGLRVHSAVITSGARLSGPTVHFVDEGYDTGACFLSLPVGKVGLLNAWVGFTRPGSPDGAAAHARRVVALHASSWRHGSPHPSSFPSSPSPGPILAQVSVAVSPLDSPQQLAARVLAEVCIWWLVWKACLARMNMRRSP